MTQSYRYLAQTVSQPRYDSMAKSSKIPGKLPPDSIKRNIGKPDRRTEILDATESLMIESGYAAVSTRRVAKEIGIKPSLVHYYFPTTDDLFLALFRRGVQQQAEKLEAATQSSNAVKTLWESYCDHERMTLATEFMALANHRDAIREEIVTATRRERRNRAGMLAQLLDLDAIRPTGVSAAGIGVLLIAAARTLIMEEGLGIDYGHRDARRIVEFWLGELAVPQPKN